MKIPRTCAFVWTPWARNALGSYLPFPVFRAQVPLLAVLSQLTVRYIPASKFRANANDGVEKRLTCCNERVRMGFLCFYRTRYETLWLTPHPRILSLFEKPANVHTILTPQIASTAHSFLHLHEPPAPHGIHTYVSSEFTVLY